MKKKLRSPLKPADRQEEILLGVPTLVVFSRLLHSGVSDPNALVQLSDQAGSNLLARDSAKPYLEREKDLTDTIMAMWKQAEDPVSDSWENIFEEATLRKKLYPETYRQQRAEIRIQREQEAQARIQREQEALRTRTQELHDRMGAVREKQVQRENVDRIQIEQEAQEQAAMKYLEESPHEHHVNKLALAAAGFALAATALYQVRLYNGSLCQRQ